MVMNEINNLKRVLAWPLGKDPDWAGTKVLELLNLCIYRKDSCNSRCQFFDYHVITNNNAIVFLNCVATKVKLLAVWTNQNEEKNHGE